ncbi:MAG: hypothetical protein H0U69_08045 [Trueperaceae bacterium]|nr:hypothetical protein [Trueperaceae bacterium]
MTSSQPPLRGAYLRPLDDPLVPARHSAGARARAAQLQAFVRPLHRVAREALPIEGVAALAIVGPDDWRRLFSYPYGFPFTRSGASGARLAGADGPTVTVVIPADYPPRLVRRFDPILLRAALAGVRPPSTAPRGPSAIEAPTPSGDVRELFDLVVGHEWGHAAAALAGLRLRVHWLDELIATATYLAALREVGASDVIARILAWAAVQEAGGNDSRRDLGAFEYPRGRLRLPQLVWFQGVLTRRAWELVGTPSDPWAFLLSLHEAVASVAPGPGTAHRGDVARALVAVEPSFRPWFEVFAAE